MVQNLKSLVYVTIVTSVWNNFHRVQVVVRAKRAQLLVFVELARCARSVQIDIKDVICM